MPSNPGRPMILVTAVVALLALTVACASTDGDAATPDGAATDRTTVPARPPMATSPGAPTAGDCLEPLTASMTESNLMPALVPCDEPHGGEVIAVYETAADLDDYPATTWRLTGVDEAVTACAGEGGGGDFAEFAGDNRLRGDGIDESTAAAGAWMVASLEAVLLLPSPSQWADGTRWVVCAAIVRHSDEALNRYDGTARGALVPGELDASFAWCKRQDDPNNSRNFVIVACSEPHTHEQVASFSLGADDASYPGDEALGQQAEATCPGLTDVATGGRYDPDSDRYGLSWTYPVESVWFNGDRTARCYVVTLDGQSAGTVAASAPR